MLRFFGYYSIEKFYLQTNYLKNYTPLPKYIINYTKNRSVFKVRKIQSKYLMETQKKVHHHGHFKKMKPFSFFPQLIGLLNPHSKHRL